MDISTSIKITGLVIGLIAIALKLFKFTRESNLRQKLIADLKIYEKTPDTYKEKSLIENHIKNQLSVLYSHQNLKRSKSTDWPNAVSTLILTIGFGYLTFYFSWDNFSLWSILTGFLCALGAEDFVRSFIGKSEKS